MSVPMGLVADAGEESHQMTFAGRDFKDWHRSGWDPSHRLADQARDGVAAGTGSTRRRGTAGI
jgi:hypothetical protein